MLQVLADVHRPLMELLVEEAFQAVLEVSAAGSSDVKAHELKGAMPPVEVGGSSAMLPADLAVSLVHTSLHCTQSNACLDILAWHPILSQVLLWQSLPRKVVH